MDIKQKLNELKNTGFFPKKILDIGANIGTFASFCHNLWNDSEILMIEGNDNCEKFLKNLPFKYEIALLSNEIKEVVFYINRNNNICTGSSYYKELTHHYNNPIKINKKTTTLDNILNKNEVFDLVKIDTQGSELDIIQGGEEIIKKSKYIILELSLKQYNENSPLFDDVVLYMKNLGFIEYEIIETHIWQNSDGLYKNGESFQVDVLFKNQK